MSEYKVLYGSMRKLSMRFNSDEQAAVSMLSSSPSTKGPIQTFALARELDLDRWSWSIYSPLPGSSLYEELIGEGKIEPYRLDYHQVHFTEAYEGICSITPERLKALYAEINDYFCRRNVDLPLGDH